MNFVRPLDSIVISAALTCAAHAQSAEWENIGARLFQGIPGDTVTVRLQVTAKEDWIGTLSVTARGTALLAAALALAAIKVCDPVSDFIFTDSRGQSVRLADYRGRAFTPSSSSGLLTEKFATAQKLLDDSGAQLLSLSIDPALDTPKSSPPTPHATGHTRNVGASPPATSPPSLPSPSTAAQTFGTRKASSTTTSALRNRPRRQSASHLDGQRLDGRSTGRSARSEIAARMPTVVSSDLNSCARQPPQSLTTLAARAALF